ncbi:MAG TPA: sigma 54-interacting transcriptional regulator [Polyangiaceae bacterium]|nr:sigma 54-interacting transcriptional regulator [Polyangiaceae bacterium]
MRAAEGSTTITEIGSLRAGERTAPLALVWVFPLAKTPAVELAALGEHPLVIGREETCDVRLQGDGVSRRHAALRRNPADGSVVIDDQGSRNGVRVNGRRAQSVRLAAGDVVRLGGWVGVVTARPGEFAEVMPGVFGGRTLKEALAPLARAAASDLPIVLEGETGTGKEVVARAVHAASGRAGPLIAVNCAALPEGLAEAELFGYRRGAFTGADRPSPGFFRSAEGGTLLLDEVSDLPMPVQAKLLRVLEEREVQPLGEVRPVPIDVRLVVAGQQSLVRSVEEGRFRADLLARVEGVTVKLPPLRDRRQDVLPLFSRLIGELGTGVVPAVESDFVERLTLHDWPFNVRELVLLVRRLLVLHADVSTLRAEHLPERLLVAKTSAESGVTASKPTSSPSHAKPDPDPIELPALVAALRASGGNVARASALLGITRQRAYRLMEGNAIDLEALRQERGEP